jgi:uncharacterized protein (DUF2252 family)
VSAIIDYNRQFCGRDATSLRLKLDRLCASPFGFLRGTFHLFATDWSVWGDDPIGTVQPIVGDLHLENLGVYRAVAAGHPDGHLVFDVNDFDETGPGTPALDLGRLGTSLVLAGKGGVSGAAGRLEAMLESWCKAVQQLDFRTIDRKALPEDVRRLFSQAEDMSPSRWLKKRVDNDRFILSDKLLAADPARRPAVEEAVRRLGYQPLDVAVRMAGTGSLGRWRYAVLTSDKLILELKEALPSSLTPAEPGEGARVIATRHRLQPDVPDHLAVTAVDGVDYTVRELQPTEAKLVTDQVHDLDAVAVAAGTVVGRLHRRGGAVPVQRRSILRRITAFALRYAEIVEEDHANLVRNRDVYLSQLGST